MQAKTRDRDHRGCRHRERCRRDPTPALGQAVGFDRLATTVGDAVERLIRSLDPSASSIAQLLARRNDDDCSCRRDTPCGCGSRTCRQSCCRDDDLEHGRGCGCGCCAPKCGRDECNCQCCIGDADVVVYTRVGETRVVPIRIENQRRRDRDITLDLGTFRTKGGNDTPVVGQLVGATAFTIAPCSEHEALLVVRVGLADRDQQNVGSVLPTGGDDTNETDDVTKAELLDQARAAGITGASAMTKDELRKALGVARQPGTIVRPIPDVDDCHVAVADLRVEGCDVRPVRIAVAVLPRDCGPYEIHCSCGCC